jgi:parallel beta-helix repeat protein
MNIYVSPQGNDTNSGTSPKQPLRTPQVAADRTNPGDTVFFMAGEFIPAEGQTILTITRSGTPGKPITFTAMPNQKATLRSNGGWEAIKVLSASYLNIKNISMRGTTDKVTMAEARKEMNNLLNPRTCGNGVIIDSKNETKDPNNTAYISKYITVSNCDIRDFPGGGLAAMHADYITFENNIVARCGFWAPYACSNISVYQTIDCDTNTGYKIIIRNNVSFGSYNNIPFYYSDKDHPEKRHVSDGNGIIIDDLKNTQAFGGGHSKPYQGKTLVINNVVFDNGGSGIHAYSASNVDIVHNYAVNNNTHPEITGGQIFANDTSDVRVLNNILVAPAGKAVNSDYNNGAGVVYDYNIYAAIDSSTPKFARDLAHNIVKSPKITLKDWEKGKRSLSIAKDSPIRRAGTNISLGNIVDRDFFGKSRPKVQPNIGPF